MALQPRSPARSRAGTKGVGGDVAGEIPLRPVLCAMIRWQLPEGTQTSPPGCQGLLRTAAGTITGTAAGIATSTARAPRRQQPALWCAQSRAGTIAEILVPSSGTFTNGKAERGSGGPG